MGLSLSSAAILEKNKLESDGVWLVLMKIVFPTTTTVRIARNTEDVVWPSSDGNTYTAFPFDLDDEREEGGGAHSMLTVRVSNVSKVIQGYMEAPGAKGGVGSDVNLYVVHNQHLDLTNAEVNETFTCTSAFAGTQWATFTLSAPNQAFVPFPERRFIKNFCSWSFNFPTGAGIKCGYSGATPYTSCNKTLADCRLRGNIRYFGSFPGIPDGSTHVNVSR
ncbi:MAG: hypothetical protein FVQ80_07100 [Planctomycetes bacterium]|nr:hypothetical protein [Planctomycetota bacterium]